MPIAEGSIIQLTFMDTLAGQTILTDFYLQVDVPGTASSDMLELQQLADDIGDSAGDFVDDWSAVLSEDLVRNDLRAQVVYPTRSVYRQSIVADTGDIAGAAAPPNIALSVTRQSATPGRKGVGRVQLAGFPASQLVNGVWNGTAQGNALTAMTNFLGAYVCPTYAGQYSWGIYNRGLGAGQNFQRTISWVPQDTGRVMRRRTVRLGI